MISANNVSASWHTSGCSMTTEAQRTTEASDDEFITRVLQFRQATEILQDVNCDFQTLSKFGLPRDRGKRSPNARKTQTNIAQQLAFLCWGDS